MRAIDVLLTLAVLAPVARADDPPAQSRASVELITSRTTRYVGEPIHVRLSVSYDDFWFREQAIPVFLRPLDVALTVDCPSLPPEPSSARSGDERRTFALNDGVAAARWLDRSRYTNDVLYVDRTTVAKAAGDLVIGPPTLRFAYADRFTDDLVNGRVAVDRKDAVVAGKALTIHVLPIPDAGRPPEFEGAIGRFDVTAEVDRNVVDFYQMFHLTIRIDADGPASIPATPRFDSIPGFHVYGARDDRGSPRRTVVYDVAAIDLPLRELPALSFAYFDPTPPATYRVARTTPIPMTVRLTNSSERDEHSEQSTDDAFWVFAWVVLGSLLVIGGSLWFFLARDKRWRARLLQQRARDATASDRFRARVARPQEDVSDALAEFLAVRLDQPIASIISPDLAARLVSAGVDLDLAGRTARTMESLVAARYGGLAVNVDEVAALVASLDGALSGRAG